MGAGLAQASYSLWGHLPDRPFRLLVHKSLVALDNDKRPKYFGGRDALVAALGLPPQPTSNQMVSRAIRVLVDSGAISRANVGRVGQRAEYWLHVSRMPKKGDSTVKRRVTQESIGRVTQESSEGDCGVNSRVTVESPQGTTTRNHRGIQGGDTSSTNVSVTAGIATVAKASESRLALVRSRADAEATA